MKGIDHGQTIDRNRRVIGAAADSYGPFYVLCGYYNCHLLTTHVRPLFPSFYILSSQMTSFRVVCFENV